jgi:hypothetical protein
MKHHSTQKEGWENHRTLLELVARDEGVMREEANGKWHAGSSHQTMRDEPSRAGTCLILQTIIPTF